MFAPITRAFVHPPAPKPPVRGTRRTVVTVLLRASALLLQAAIRLQHPAVGRSMPAAAPRPDPPWLTREFHAEAGAPEGALYVGGEFVGRLPGVQRL